MVSPRTGNLNSNTNVALSSYPGAGSFSQLKYENSLGKPLRNAWLFRTGQYCTPSCTGEGANYSIECLTCRKEGKRRIYFGETSRSPYQRGSEHQKEVREGILTHPLVIHSIEEHEGITQPILMRTLSAHLTPMDRQIQESLNIILETKKEGNCLNQKSEWA